jgi:hypothetical protein
MTKPASSYEVNRQLARKAEIGARLWFRVVAGLVNHDRARKSTAYLVPTQLRGAIETA